MSADATNDEGEIRFPQFIADVVDEVLHVVFILTGRISKFVIESLEPDKAFYFEIGSPQFAEVLFVVLLHVDEFHHHVFVGFAEWFSVAGITCTGGTEIVREGMSAPSRFDEDHGVIEMLAHRVAKFEFDPSAATRSKAGSQRAFTTEKFDEDIVSYDPLFAVS